MIETTMHCFIVLLFNTKRKAIKIMIKNSSIVEACKSDTDGIEKNILGHFHFNVFVLFFINSFMIIEILSSFFSEKLPR